MAGKLEPFGIPIFFSINPAQRETYAAFISSRQLVEDVLPLAGPMKGLLSVHEQFPSKDILLLACDMLDLDKATIAKVLDARRSDDQYDFYVYGGTAFAQPFCGFYTARGLAPAYRMATSLTQLPLNSPTGSWSDLSLQSLLRRGKTLWLEVARQEAFANYNSL